MSSTSFDHWHDQLLGVRECARVLDGGGQLVLCDLFSALLISTLAGDRRAKDRTRRLIAIGVTSELWVDVGEGVDLCLQIPGEPMAVVLPLLPVAGGIPTLEGIDVTFPECLPVGQRRSQARRQTVVLW
ncbi:hypothetical protein [Microlunatus endophyticus]